VTEHLDDAGADTALSTVILQRVGSGEIGPTLRVFVPGRIVAFGSQDATRPTYPEAVGAVRELGFAAVERLAGGKAAVFHEGTIAFAWATPHPDPKLGIEERFEQITAVILDALHRLGAVGAVGEIPGEYCPGRFSVSVEGRKVMGVGQRLVKGAAHVGGVLVMQNPELVNLALTPAYDRLGYDWRPEVTGAVGLSTERGAGALIEAFGTAGHDVTTGALEPVERRQALAVAEAHTPPIA